MATSLRSLATSTLRRRLIPNPTSFSAKSSFGAAAGQASASASGFVSTVAAGSLAGSLAGGLLLAGSSEELGAALILATAPPTAKCQVKAVDESIVDKSSSSSSSSPTDLRERAEALYSEGRLADVYALLNENPLTKDDANLLFRLALTSHKMSLTTSQPERRRILNDEALLIVMKASEEAGRSTENRRNRADILSLYGAIIQQRASRKEGEERKRLLALAQEHMTAGLREEATNFLANHALADLHFEMAQERTELGRKSLSGIAIWDKTNNNKLSETDQESLWRATARHAYVALKAKPDDLNSINHMAQAKFAIGDLATAKRYTLQALAAEKDAKFVDEKQAAKDCKDLMDKINALLGDNQ